MWFSSKNMYNIFGPYTGSGPALTTNACSFPYQAQKKTVLVLFNPLVLEIGSIHLDVKFTSCNKYDIEKINFTK